MLRFTVKLCLGGSVVEFSLDTQRSWLRLPVRAPSQRIYRVKSVVLIMSSVNRHVADLRIVGPAIQHVEIHLPLEADKSMNIIARNEKDWEKKINTVKLSSPTASIGIESWSSILIQAWYLWPMNLDQYLKQQHKKLQYWKL